MEDRGFKGVWIPKEIWLDTELSLIEKCLLVEIDSLDCNPKHCYKSNEGFAEFLGCSVPTVSRAIRFLSDKRLIAVEVMKTQNGSVRTIKSLIKMIRATNQNDQTPTNQNDQHSNTSSSLQKKDKSNTYPQDSHPVILATLLLTEHRKIDEKFLVGKEESSIQRWADDIEKLIRIDNRTPEEIRSVILWTQSPGCFWASNILSGAKLREKFPTLIGQSSRTKNNATPLFSRDIEETPMSEMDKRLYEKARAAIK